MIIPYLLVGVICFGLVFFLLGKFDAMNERDFVPAAIFVGGCALFWPLTLMALFGFLMFMLGKKKQ